MVDPPLRDRSAHTPLPRRSSCDSRQSLPRASEHRPDIAADRGCRRCGALRSNPREGARRKRGVCPAETLSRPLNRALQGLARGFRVRLRAIESLVEAHVADEALEPRDKVLRGVRIPSPRVYSQAGVLVPVSVYAQGALWADQEGWVAQARKPSLDAEKGWTPWARGYGMLGDGMLRGSLVPDMPCRDGWWSDHHARARKRGSNPPVSRLRCP